MNMTAHAVLFMVCALGVHCAPSSPPVPDLPEILASSKYIDYSTDTNPSKLCMDDLLSQEDRFIEDVAAYLNTAPPSGRIRYLQQSRSMDGEFGGLPDEPCEGKIGCYTYYKEQDLGVIHTISAAQYHELAHAVDIPAFGPDTAR